MQIGRIIILWVCLAFSALALRAQDEAAPVFEDLETALATPMQVQKYYLDCSLGDDSLFFASLNKFPNLKSLTLVGYENSRFPASLFTAGKFTRLCLSECYDLDFNTFFKNLSICKRLNSLLIDECDLSLIPPELSLLPALEKVVITNCENLDPENSIKNLATCKALKYLGLPVNQICEIPLNINLLSKLEVLDISNNVLIDLPDGMLGLTSLQVMNTEGNLFENPVEALAKVGSLQIKYLSIDNDMTAAELARLRQIFPLATIQGKSPAETTAPDPNQIPDPTPPEDSTVYGTFRQMSDAMILSDAYLHYPDVFRNFNPNYDSLLFDERYSRPEYSNVYRIIPGRTPDAIGGVALYSWGRKHIRLKDKEIYFNFYKVGDGYTEAIKRYNKELMAFRGMCWTYRGDLSQKEFKKKFIARFHKKRPPENCYNDCRITYDDMAKTFVLELKSNGAFESFTTFPVLENTTDRELSKEQYNKRYYRYLSSLDSRRKRFNKQLLKNKILYQDKSKKIFNSLWVDFSVNYLSKEEKQMTPEEWLNYYDWIVSHEKLAYDGAPVTTQLIQRYFYLNRYINNINVPNMLYDSASAAHKIYFADAEQLKLVVRDIFIVNTLQKMYLYRQGSLGVAPNELILGASPSICLILIMRNGNIGVLKPEAYSRILSGSGEQEVTVEIFDKSLLTFGQLKQMLGL